MTSVPSRNFFSQVEYETKEPLPDELIPNWLMLRDGILNPGRLVYGRQIMIVSGYRSFERNDQAREKSIARIMKSGLTRAQAEDLTGVAKHSQHSYGRAADICPPPKDPQGSMKAMNRAFAAAWKQGLLPALGYAKLYPGWLHVDCRKPVMKWILDAWAQEALK